MSKGKITAGVLGSLLALSMLAAPAVAADPDPALTDYTGSVLGGEELTFPPKERFLDFAKVSSSANFSLGIDTDGYVWGWGLNGLGNLGNTSHWGHYRFIEYPAPMYDVNGDHFHAKDLIAMHNHSYVLDDDGYAWAYGWNAFSELGNPQGAKDGNSKFVVPLPVLDAEGDQMQFDRIESAGYAGYAGYGIKSDGTVWTWGRNQDGELGNSGLPVLFYSSYHTPVPLRGADGEPMIVKQISGGEQSALAIDSEGRTWGWGMGSDGELGPRTSARANPVPVLIADGTDTPMTFTEVASGRKLGLGIDPEGNTWSWGKNESGGLGNPLVPVSAPDDESLSAVPIPVVDEHGIQQKFIHVTTGGQNAYGIKSDGTVWAWGSNTEGQLGDPALPVGNKAHRNYAAPVLNADGSTFKATQVSAGGTFATAIAPADANGHTSAWSWGENWYGQLGSQAVPSGQSGNRSLVTVPVTLPQPTGETRLYLGEDDTVGITGTVSADGMTVTYTMPAHEAGRVPLFLSWAGDGILRESVGFYTYTLDPSLKVSPASVKPGESTTATITLPEAEIPYIGASSLDVSLADGLARGTDDASATSAFTGQFDAEGKLVFPVTSAVVGSYTVQAQAVVRETGEDDVVVSAALTAPAVFAEETKVPEIPPSEKPKPPTTTPPKTIPPTVPGTTSPTKPASAEKLSTTGAEQSLLVALFLLGAGAVAFSLTRLRRRRA